MLVYSKSRYPTINHGLSTLHHADEHYVHSIPCMITNTKPWNMQHKDGFYIFSESKYLKLNHGQSSKGADVMSILCLLFKYPILNHGLIKQHKDGF